MVTSTRKPAHDDGVEYLTNNRMAKTPVMSQLTHLVGQQKRKMSRLICTVVVGRFLHGSRFALPAAVQPCPVCNKSSRPYRA